MDLLQVLEDGAARAGDLPKELPRVVARVLLALVLGVLDERRAQPVLVSALYESTKIGRASCRERV